jgi:hypothetical protein
MLLEERVEISKGQRDQSQGKGWEEIESKTPWTVPYPPWDRERLYEDTVMKEERVRDMEVFRSHSSGSLQAPTLARHCPMSFVHIVSSELFTHFAQ